MSTFIPIRDDHISRTRKWQKLKAVVIFVIKILFYLMSFFAEFICSLLNLDHVFLEFKHNNRFFSNMQKKIRITWISEVCLITYMLCNYLLAHLLLRRNSFALLLLRKKQS